MRIIFINYIGTNYKGYNVYEFLFTSQDIMKIEGEDWDSYPAAGNPMPPTDYVETVCRLETMMVFELIQNHESFDMSDCMQGVIALAWEDDKESDDDMYLKRLFFQYGEEIDVIKDKFYERDIYLETILENAKK